MASPKDWHLRLTFKSIVSCVDCDLSVVLLKIW